jgi:hypothetical protein
MRDWSLVLAPIVFAAYFMLFPEQFGALITWATELVR